MWCACVRLTADQAGLQKIAEKFKKYDFSALLLVGGFEVSSLVSIQIVELLSSDDFFLRYDTIEEFYMDSKAENTA